MPQVENALDKLCREVFGAYQYLHDHDLAAESGTSKRLRAGDKSKLKARLLEELHELQGVVEGTHFHEGFDADLILEGYEVLYWAFCWAVALQYSYDSFEPGKQLESGFNAPRLTRAELLPYFQLLLQEISHTEVIPTEKLGQVAFLVGRACALNGTAPSRLLERDRNEMQQKSYLVEYWLTTNDLE